MPGGRSVRRRSILGAGALALAVVLGACTSPGGDSSSAGGGGGGGGGAGLPESITVMAVNGFTGPVSFAGLAAQKGYDLAVKDIEADGLLGDTTVTIDYKDSASSAQEAASFASQAISDPTYTAILGPSASSQAAAVSPIVQQAGMPTVYVQAGSEGVVTGDFTYRLTPPAQSYYGLAGEYVESLGATSASVVFNSGNPTLAELGQNTAPQLAEEHGFQISDTSGVELTQQDFTAVASQIAASGSGVAFLELQGPQYPVAITQLRRAGYQGDVVLMSAAGAGNLTPAGEQAAGAVWPSNFTATQSDASSQAFVEAYGAEYNGEVPNNYAAEAYDAMWFLARGIAEADSADRAAVQQGMASVAMTGFDGAQGAITFDGNDARVPGVMVQWDGSKEVALSEGGS